MNNTDPRPRPAPAAPRTRSAHPAVRCGNITGEDPWLYLPVTLGGTGEHPATRVDALAPIIEALGAVTLKPWETDREGRRRAELCGRRAVVDLLRARLGVILAQAERAARAATRETDDPPRTFTPLTALVDQMDRATARARWSQAFTVGYCAIYAARISAALDGDRAACPARRSPLLHLALHGADGGADDLATAGRRCGQAAATRLRPGEFASYPAALGRRRTPTRTAVMVVTYADAADLTGATSLVHVADTAGAPGAERIRALIPVLTACRVRLVRVARHEDGMRLRRADTATLEGHPQLVALAARSVTALVDQMDRATARAAPRAPQSDAERARWCAHYRAAWGAAYAARLTAALTAAPTALADLPDPVGAAAYRAALAVNEIPAAQLHRLAARVAAVTDPAQLPHQGAWYLEIDPSPLYAATHRAHGALAIARAYGLAADAPGGLAGPGPAATRCAVIRLAGPDDLADAVITALPRLFARADAVVSAHLPAWERYTDQRRSLRHHAAARETARAGWSGRVVELYLLVYAERLEAARAGAPGARRRSARQGAWDTRGALLAADAIDPAELAGVAARCARAQDALDTAWCARQVDRRRQADHGVPSYARRVPRPPEKCIAG